MTMAPPKFPSARTKLLYPLYACDFDPQDSNRLVVGGGGGPGRSGVGNKISILSSSTTDDLHVAGEIDLPRDEDSVSCIAVGQKKGRSTLIYAGINSSAADIAKGKNEHFRVFAAEPTKSRSAGANVAGCKITELNRTGLFEANHPEKYQRILRLAPSSGNTQLGAAASGFGKDFEIALFDVGTTGAAAPRSRGLLQLTKEANDVDVVQTGEDTHRLAYCDNYELFVVDVAKETSVQPQLAFSMPLDEADGRPQFRFIRFLSPTFVLAAVNLPKKAGVVLQGLRLPTKPDERARIAINTRLPRKTSATAFAVRNLSPPSSPGAKLDKAQFVIAIAGHDSSIYVYTLDHKSSSEIELIYDLLPLARLTDIHSMQITGLALSIFTPPKTTSRQQFVKLASISMEDTAVIHSIPLKKVIDRPAHRHRGPPRPARYVVAAKSQRPSSKPLIFGLSIIVLILAVVGQGILEIYGSSPPILGARRIYDPYLGPLRTPKNEFINNILGGLDIADAIPRNSKNIVLRDEPVLAADEADATSQIQVGLDYDEGHGKASSWEELTAKQKALWKARLEEAGHWGEGMGETVFKGVLFGEIAGAVGRAMG